MMHSILNMLTLTMTLVIFSFVLIGPVHAAGETPFQDAVSVPSHKLANKAIQGIKTAIDALSADEPFAFYDLHFSSSERGSLQKIAVQKSEEYEYFGTLPIPHKDLTAYLKRIGPNRGKVADAAAQVITKIVTHLLQASGKEAAWMCLRATIPHKEFDIPRWHMDGYFYKPWANQYKFAIALKGPPTLFYQVPSTKREKFYDLLASTEAYQMSKEARQKTAAFLNDPRQRFQAQPNQGGVFVVGEQDSGVHSEPPMTEERLFLSVLPGSKAQIKERQEDLKKWATENEGAD